MEWPANSQRLAEFSALLVRERRALIAVAANQGLRPEEALECVQDALCAWLAEPKAERVKAEPDPDPSAHLLASLKLRVKNRARNWRRLHRRLKPHLPIDEAHALASSHDDAERLIDAAETALRLRVCVAELREVERAAITLRLLEERSGEDVARALQLSRAHVDVLVHRAKASLRACMQAPNCAS